MSATPQRRWLLGVARSVCGASHRRLGRGCDDASLMISGNRGFVMAVCDGAGSAVLSQEGATAAAKAAVEWLQENAVSFADPGWRRHLERGVAQVSRRVYQRASQLDTEPRELATTLLMAFVWPYGVIAAQVGDGALVVEEEEKGDLKTVLIAPREVVSNITHFVTDSDALRHARFVRWRGDLRGFVAMTDGLECLAISSDGEPYGPFVSTLLRRIHRCGGKREARKLLSGLLGSEKLQRHTDDDVTLAIGLFNEPDDE